jgi:hypothetical protein
VLNIEKAVVREVGVSGEEGGSGGRRRVVRGRGGTKGLRTEAGRGSGADFWWMKTKGGVGPARPVRNFCGVQEAR